MKEYNKIKGVEPMSIAEEAGITAGDTLVSIDDTKVEDILQYKYLCAAEELTIEILKKNGDTEFIEIEKDEYEDLGIEFEYPLLGPARACANKCIFCFIDQLPCGMRKTLYFKDDDSRLSFLHGNYVTLTNLSDADIDRLCATRVSPVNISVHATDPEVRKFMMGNKNAGNVVERMKKFARNGIVMNCQIVLCRGINDKKVLDDSIKTLGELYPHVYSVSVVPVGLTDHRDGLFELEGFDRESAKEVIERVSAWQQKFYKKYGTRIVYLADEFYLKAEMPIPDAEEYEDFPQIENGVGLISSMQEEFDFAIKNVKPLKKERTVSMATGEAAFEFISSLARRLEQVAKGLKINVYSIKNITFGEKITVAGLLCGKDIIKGLQGKELGQTLYLPNSLLRDGENVLLDDVTTDDLEMALGVKIETIDCDGETLVAKLTNDGN
ncbi:MAG: DUF512 domain-containing protein [Clostridia bacterium]|nr:DUF512 domain-containing protein [Clostridia bacterium]